jgi:hypothetical protein
MGDFSQSQLMALTRDPDFQSWVGSDPELDAALNTPPKTRDDRFVELGLALGGVVSAGEVKLPPPTLGAVMILGTIDSPFLNHRVEMRMIDVDIACWIIARGRGALEMVSSIADVEAAAAGMCDEAGLDREDARDTIRAMLAESFAAFERIPCQHVEKGARCYFDLAWFTSCCSRVAQAANVTADYAGWEMPLTMANYYLLAWHVQQGGKVDKHPTSGEKVMRRLREMMREWIAKKGYQ